MGTIKAKNGRDLVDAEEIKKRWKQYTEELYKEEPEIKFLTLLDHRESYGTPAKRLPLFH